LRQASLGGGSAVAKIEHPYVPRLAAKDRNIVVRLCSRVLVVSR
jgi:hypothetical protein